MNDKVKEALETLANLIFSTGAYDYVDESVEVRLYGKEAEYLSALLAEKTRTAVRKLG